MITLSLPDATASRGPGAPLVVMDAGTLRVLRIARPAFPRITATVGTLLLEEF